MIPDSKTLEITRPLAAVAALFHDWGKASDGFQKKLRTHSRKKDPLRHEWVSCKMLEAVWCLSGCGEDDETWMAAILNGNIDSRSIEAGLQRMQADDSMKKFPYSTPTIMRILMWLILTHHRMPMTKDYEKYEEVSLSSMGAVLKRIHAGWGYSNDEAADACLKFSHGVLLDDEDWASATKDALPALLKEKDAICAMSPQKMRLVLVLSRETLMLADHSVSADKKSAEAKLYANTDSGGNLCEPLSSHLVRTAEQAERILAAMPQIADGMVAVEHVRFGRSPGRFKWQDDAVDKIRQNKEIMNSSAYFVLNMASTGCGKTTANAKIMQALSDDGKSMRYTLALGLRSLTLQTGAEYRERMHLSKDDLAVIIGSAAVQKLDEQERKQDRREPLIPEPLDYSSILDDEKMMRFLDIFLNDGKNAEKNKAYLLKPVLVTTIDQIIGATETVKGGRGLLPFLRLLSSDFVIDEIDDFSPEDLTAIARLVHLVGMLGRNIILSSATIPPDLAIGLYQAYADGLSCRNAFADPMCHNSCQ